MEAKKIRQKFINFFSDYMHEKHNSSSLVPIDDPTLLFANAGMNQFKDFFTGKSTSENKRAVTVQKCVRAGGKHNDLENVGFTARHHTFFEMLGNFSFGDYFKKEAIEFAWKFLTEELNIPAEKLYISVHDSDDEAERIWNLDMKVPMSRIFRMGDKDNFWEMGEVGPCGPCSEIYYDHGPKYQTHSVELDNPLEDEGRFVEIWNLVFMQYEQTKEGRVPLPNPCVDTGAGLERIAALMQGVYWNYDTDLFSPILNAIEVISGKKYSDSRYESNFRVVADHIRSSTMLITDGVMPSNEGRGYVLRRIIRRAVRHLSELGLTKSSLHSLVPSVFEVLGHEYIDNKNNQDLAEKLLLLEEDKFRETLDIGLKILKTEINKIKENKDTILHGEIAFKLYDSYGFPVDLTEVIAQENNLELDTKGFELCMAEQKKRSKSSNKFKVQDDNLKKLHELKEKLGETRFLGYSEIQTNSTLLHLDKFSGQWIALFDQTPFYAESGGQVGDIGQIEELDIKVIDTQKAVDGLFVHYLDRVEGLEVGQKYSLYVDTERRDLIKRNHSATHLLQAALVEELGDHVKQAGSFVDNNRLRFDFTHTQGLRNEELDRIEKRVNEKIQHQLSVNWNTMSKEKALEKGATALFGEKYGSEVRVVEMGVFSTELCGGTHVSNTSEIGLFSIVSEGSLASGVRRIEAMSSSGAIDYLKHRSNQLSLLENATNSNGSKLLETIKKKDKTLQKLTKEVEQLKIKLLSGSSHSLFSRVESLNNGIDLVIEEIESNNSKELRAISDQFTDKFNDKVLLLLGKSGDKVSFIIKRHKKDQRVDLKSATQSGFKEAGIRGGGKPDMIQGSIDKSQEAMILELVKNSIERV